MAMILEVLRHGRGAEVRERMRVGEAPLTIGRALDNALVLDDPHVDAHHARLVRDADGTLFLEDLGTVNRIETRLDGPRDRVTVAHATVVTLGRTALRFRDDAVPVPVAIPLHGVTIGGDARTQWYRRTKGRAGIVVTSFAIAALNAWLGSTERGAGSAVFSVLLIGSALAIAWAGVWAIAARVVLGQFQFLAHITVVALAFAAFEVIDLLSGWSAFLFPSVTAIGPVQTGALLVVLTSIVAWHLGSATHLARAQRWRIGTVASLIVVAIMSVSALLDDEAFSAAAEYSGVIKPVNTALVPTVSASEFGVSIAELRSQVDSAMVTRDR